MVLRSIEIKNFRNHIHTQLEFSENLNLFVGGNAQGKTSILEAISYLCLTKSFNASSDSYVLNFNARFFEVFGTFELDNGNEVSVKVNFENGQGKKVFLNKENVGKFAIIVNKFPVVILSPRSKNVVHGAPEDRRKFFDLAIAQLSSVYVDDILNYKRVLKQRNRVLSAIASEGIRLDQGLDLLNVWDEEFINYAAKIIFRKNKFMNDFIIFFKRAYSSFSESENAEIKYLTQVEVGAEDDFDKVRDKFEVLLKKSRAEEIKRGVTLVGPHRDEYIFEINGRDIRRFASQGQMKTFLIALTMAKFFYLKERKSETPILLLDDVFDELDVERTKKFISFVGDVGQVFITVTDLNVLSEMEGEFKMKKFIVNSGRVIDA